MKRDAQGRDHELADADYAGSAFEEEIREGFFDGPEVIAALTKVDGKWEIRKDARGREAYVVGPTDLAYETWDADFDLPRRWFGL